MANLQSKSFHYIRPEWEEDVWCRIRNYIFYWSEYPDIRRGFCTRCGAEMEALRTDGGMWKEFYKAKHNSEGYCPVCGNYVMFRAMGKLRNPSTLDHAVRMLFVDVFSPRKSLGERVLHQRKVPELHRTAGIRLFRTGTL